jgi:hypothetical protein
MKLPPGTRVEYKHGFFKGIRGTVLRKSGLRRIVQLDNTVMGRNVDRVPKRRLRVVH